MQAPQSAASAQGSVVPPLQSEVNQLQSVHEPLSGPLELPVSQVPVSPQNPQG